MVNNLKLYLCIQLRQYPVLRCGRQCWPTAFRNTAAPAQNNGSIYNVIYTYRKDNWIVQPYFQYTDVPTNQELNIPQAAATRGGALLVNYNFKHHLSLSGRGEYSR